MAASWRVSPAFTRQFASFANLDIQAKKAGEAARMWKRIFYFVAVPCIFLGILNNYLASKKEKEHFKRPPFVQMEYLRIRTKRFPWGDGTKSLFHNPEVNALPTGYEHEE